MNLSLFNTLSRTKELFRPQKPPQVSMYCCGPTVYDYAHIGNFRTYLFEDTLRRFLDYSGYQVTHVVNITDIDDKTIRQANAHGQTLQSYTNRFTEAFLKDCRTLRILPAHHYPRATEWIDAMIAMIQRLLDKKIAYRGEDGSIYFAIDRFSDYGKLSKLKLDELEVGRSERILLDEYEKQSASDFVLWKNYDPARDGEICFESPFGRGRPGWHIECSAMATSLLGPSIDLHLGAIDNIFPHHENEIAQSESCFGDSFCRTWLHCDHLIVDGKKMAKSAANFYTLRDILARGYRGEEIRLLFLQSHYRSKLNFTFQSLDGAKQGLRRLQTAAERLRGVESTSPNSSQRVEELIRKTTLQIEEALGDDLNTPLALSYLFSSISTMNQFIDEQLIGATDRLHLLQWLQKIDRLFALFEKEEETIPPAVLQALEERILARRDKNWQRADELRAFIEQAGYVVEDSKEGSKAKKA